MCMYHFEVQNGEDYLSGNSFLFKLVNLSPPHAYIAEEDLWVKHSDLCFSNMSVADAQIYISTL